MNHITAQISWLTGMLAFYGLVSVCIMALLRVGSHADLLMAQVTAMFFFLGHIVFNTKRKSISFVLALQGMFFVALPAYVQTKESIYPFNGNPSTEGIYSAISIISFSYACILLGFWVGEKFNKKKTVSLPINLERVSRTSWCIGLFAMILAMFAGPNFMLTARNEAAEFAQNAGGLLEQLKILAQASGFVAFCTILNLALNGSNRVQKVNMIALLFAFPCFMFLFFPPALPRFQLFGAMLGISVLLLDYSRIRNKIMLILASIPAVFFMFPAIKSLGSGGSVSDVIGQIGSRGILEYIVRVDFDMFLWTAEMSTYLKEGGEKIFGVNFLGFFLSIIPRSIWPSKAVSTGSIVSEAQGYYYFNVSSPIWSEAQISFGAIGILIVMVAIGAKISSLEKNPLALNTQAGLHATNQVIVWTAYLMIVFRGSLSGVGTTVVSAFFFVYLYNFLTKKRKNDCQ